MLIPVVFKLGGHAYGISMFSIGTAAAIFGTVPMIWIVVVTYSDKSVVITMLKKIVEKKPQGSGTSDKGTPEKTSQSDMSKSDV